MSPLQTIAYQASGGDSERRSYAGGEGLTIESQDEGYVLAWSARTHAQDFLRIVSQLVDVSTETELSLPPVPTDKTVAYEKEYQEPAHRTVFSLADALSVVADHPEVEAIEIHADDETFVWTATDPYARERRDLTRVMLAFSALNEGQIVRLLEDTGAPHIRNDLAGIVASAAHLTHSDLSATA